MLINLKTIVNTEAVVQKELPFEIDDVISYEEGGKVMIAKVDVVTIVSTDELYIHDTNDYSFTVRFDYDPNGKFLDARTGPFKLVNRTKNFPKQ